MNLRNITYNFLFGFLFIILFLVSGFRVGSGTDYDSYVSIYQSFADGGRYWKVLEPGFESLLLGLNYLSSNPRIFFIFSSFVTLTFIFKGIYYNSRGCIISVVVFFSMYFYFFSFNLIRQFIAISFFFGFCIPALKNREPIKYFVFVVAASFFHLSAIFMIPFYIILSRTYGVIGYIAWVAFFFVGFVLYPYLMDFMFSVAGAYRSYSDYSSGSSNLFIFSCLSLIVPILPYFKKFINIDGFNIILFNGVFFSILIAAFSYHNILFFRLSMYLSVFSILLVPAIGCSFGNFYGRCIYFSFVFLILFSAFYYYLKSNMAGVLPYSFDFMYIF